MTMKYGYSNPTTEAAALRALQKYVCRSCDCGAFWVSGMDVCNTAADQIGERESRFPHENKGLDPRVKPEDDKEWYFVIQSNMADPQSTQSKRLRASEEIQQQIRERTIGYITGGLGVVAGLAWNEAIRTTIEVLFPLKKDTLPAQFVYAAIITVVVVVFTIYLTKLISQHTQQK